MYFQEILVRISKPFQRLMSGNILLIGGTGYLGAHIAYAFLSQNEGDIYFLVRNVGNISPKYRLLENLKLYFGDNFTSKVDNRIKVITGDMTSNSILGTDKNEIYAIIKNISTVVNAGGYNVDNLIRFCRKCGKKLMHISTTSISGNKEKSAKINNYNSNNKRTFAETNLYIGQDLTSEFNLNEFKAELKILDAIYDGLDAQILRLGNITNRYSDGLFSNNSKHNTFIQKLKSYIGIGAFPKSFLGNSLDFTPVDLAANAIVTIMNYSSDCNVFHIVESNKPSVSLLAQSLNEIGIDIIPVSNKLLFDAINGILGDEERRHLITGISEDLDNSKKIVHISDVNLASSFTEDYLKNCGFKWKKIDKNYILKYLNYFKKTGIINF